MERKQLISIFLVVIMLGSVFAYALSSIFDEEDTPEEHFEEYTIPSNITPDMIYAQYIILNETERAWAEFYMNATYYGVEINPEEHPMPSNQAGYFYILYITYLEQQYALATASMNSTNMTTNENL